MYVEQIYTSCLAEAAYYIESNGEAAIIDPMREIEPYVLQAKKRNAVIKYVFETHFHADFVSGHVDLAKETGATIVFGPTTLKTGYKAQIGKDGQEFQIGACIIKLIHTPGHTMESSCYLLKDENGNEQALFTGDTLFIGDVGRPDLAQKVIAELTPEILAGHFYDSLRNKIIPLNDELIIYPGHGQGSACGKNMSKETTDTLGHQKKVNYALNPALNKEEFIQQILNGLTPPPLYFPQDVLLNIGGYQSMDTIIKQSLKPLSAVGFSACIDMPELFLIDTREAQKFAKGFIRGSVNIGIDGSFAVWAGTVIEDVHRPVLIVSEPGREKEAITRLARIGCDNVLGFLEGGIDTWVKAGHCCESINSIDVHEFRRILKTEDVIIDARKASEFESEHLINAVNFPLNYIKEMALDIDKDKTYYVYCAGGYRSMTFISLFKAVGLNNLVDIKGGFSALKASGQFPITEFHEALTML